MRILVCGSREWTDKPLFAKVMDGYRSEITELVEGCARGADQMAEQWAAARGVAVRHFPAEWDKYGKAAGYRRNTQMLTTNPDLVIAFTEDLAQSRGTSMMINLSRRAGIPVMVVSATLVSYL